MATTPESLNTTYVNKLLDFNLVRSWKVFDSITIGKPDSEYIRRDGKRGSVLKIEYKYIHELPKRADTLVTPNWQNAVQQQKLGEYFTCDGNALAVIFVGKRDAQCIVFLTKDEWDNGLTKAQCEKRLISRRDLAAYITWRVTNGQAGTEPAFARATDARNQPTEQRTDHDEVTLL